MSATRKAVAVLLASICLVSLAASLWLPRESYARQDRETPGAAPSARHPLGADSLGRDRLVRLLYATALSMTAAVLSALLSLTLAAVIGGAAGYIGGGLDRCIVFCIDLALSLPWLFLLITARALLPLNVDPLASVLVTFGILGVLGWPAPARVIRAGARELRDSNLVLQGRACGLSRGRILVRHLLPNLRPILRAQFWTSIPAFILSEANLGMLGLGVGEPVPSWGNMLRQLQSEPHWNAAMLAPLALLVVVLSGFQLVFRTKELDI